MSLTYTSWVVLTSSINTQNISVTRRTPYSLRLWVYLQDSVCDFDVTNLLNIKVLFDGWVRKKERTSKNDELTVTECEIKLLFVVNVSVVL